jgi:pimeloyl-ACP methyl ester carboxylesterase
VPILVVAAVALTLATLALATLWRVGLAIRRRPAPGFWKRTFKWHAMVFAFHLLVTAPLVLALLVARAVGTRGDESAYVGPRVAEDGRWAPQTRASLAAEMAGTEEVSAPVEAAAASHAVSLVARDGVTLRGFLVPAPATPGASGPRFLALLVHGLYRGALEIETPGAMFHDLGGEVLLLELRNHGGSGRARSTFGRDEALDVVAAADFLQARPEAAGRPLVLFGVSLGTAAVALAAPRLPELGGLVLDAPMDDLAATARRALGGGRRWQAIREPWASVILFFFRSVGRVPVDQVRPREALARLSPDVDVLFIGAGHDDRMPPDSVRALFEALPTPADRKELWIEPEATHGKVWVKSPEEYRRRLARFCEKVIEHRSREAGGARTPGPGRS